MKMIAEEWKPFQGFEGCYEASSMGRIRSLDRTITKISRTGREFVHRTPGRELRPRIQNSGYLVVTLCMNGTPKDLLVHRAVASAFLGAIPDGMEVNHKNGNKLDNSAANLEFLSHKKNIEHARACGLANNKGERNGGAKLTADDVLKIVPQLGRRFDREIAADFGVSSNAIWKIRRGVKWSHLTGIKQAVA